MPDAQGHPIPGVVEVFGQVAGDIGAGDVLAGTKPPSRARHMDSPDGPVGLDLGQHGQQPLEHGIVETVQDIRPVQGHPSHPVTPFE